MAGPDWDSCLQHSPFCHDQDRCSRPEGCALYTSQGLVRSADQFRKPMHSLQPGMCSDHLQLAGSANAMGHDGMRECPLESFCPWKGFIMDGAHSYAMRVQSARCHVPPHLAVGAAHAGIGCRHVHEERKVSACQLCAQNQFQHGAALQGRDGGNMNSQHLPTSLPFLI